MKKILICLPSQHYNKYLEFDAFKELQKNFDVHFLLNKNKWKIPPNKIKKNIFINWMTESMHIS